MLCVADSRDVSQMEQNMEIDCCLTDKGRSKYFSACTKQQLANRSDLHALTNDS